MLKMAQKMSPMMMARGVASGMSSWGTSGT